MEGNVLEVAALGRVFRPGMLYDARTDNPVPTEALWNQSTIDSALKITPQPGTELSIDAGDTLSSKASHLDVNVGLKLSFLGGLVKVTGSAAYLDDRKSSEHVERVSLKYKATTQLLQLGMEVLGKAEYPDVFDKDIATHVVTAVLYGGQAVFVFDRRVANDESHREVKGNLEIIVNSIPGVEISGKGDLRMDEKEQKEANHFKCTFHGDFKPSRNPTTFKDAVEIYKILPSLLGENGENAVPVMVWLYPLEKLDNKAKRILREISSNLVDQVEAIFEEIHSLEMRCNDLKDHDASQYFWLIQDKLGIMGQHISSYRTVFQKSLTPILPEIRGGGKGEAALIAIIRERDRCPFNYIQLNAWLDTRKIQLDVLARFVEAMKGVKFASAPGDIEKVILDPKSGYVVLYVFVLNRRDDQYLDILNAYIHSEKEESTDWEGEIMRDRELAPKRVNDGCNDSERQTFLGVCCRK